MCSTRLSDADERGELEPEGGLPLPRLVVALRAEARPVIERFGLEPIEARSAYPIFRGARALLIVAGVGKLRAAAATAYLHAASGSVPGAPWINVGIAGHPSASPGAVFLAHKVIEESSGRAWYPPLVFDPPIPTATGRTFEAPDERYENAAELSDMEAAGFLATATGYSTRELVHVLKVVSDNPDTRIASVNAASATEWVAGLVPALETL